MAEYCGNTKQNWVIQLIINVNNVHNSEKQTVWAFQTVSLCSNIRKERKSNCLKLVPLKIKIKMNYDAVATVPFDNVATVLRKVSELRNVRTSNKQQNAA
jgi:hypothetical protein